MPQSGQTPIQHYRSSTASATPDPVNLLEGELALNFRDGRLFFKDHTGAARLLASTAAATGTVSSINASGGSTGLTFSGGPVTTSGTLTIGGTLAVANGGTGATAAAAARTNLGATTVGANIFTLTNPSAVRFLRLNANNTVDALDAAAFRTAIGAGSSSTNGTVTSVGGTGSVNGITLSGTVTSSGNLTLGGTLSGVSLTTQVAGTLPVANGGTGATSSTGTGSVVLNNTPTFVGTILAPNNGLKFASDGSQDTGIDWVSDGVFRVLCNAVGVGTFSAAGWTGNVVGNVTGNATTATNATTAGNANNLGGVAASDFARLSTSPTFAGTVSAPTFNANNSTGFRNNFNGFQYNEWRNGHVAFYKVSSNDFAYYFRSSDNGAIDGPNQQTMAEFYNNRLLFFSSGAERLRIAGNGNVGVGNASPTERLHVTGNILASSNITAFSDERLKENIETVDKALDKVRNMRGVTYTRKDTGEVGTGVIAQEMLCVMPEVVNTNGEYMSVAYGNLVGVLIEAIKELSDEVAELRSKA